MTVGTPVRVEITLTSNQQAVDVSQFFQFFSFIGAYTVSNENRGFSLVSPNSEYFLKSRYGLRFGKILFQHCIMYLHVINLL